MDVAVLPAIPLAGTVPERHYDVSAGENAWVRFDDGEGGEWVGVFGAGGVSPFTAAVPFGDDGGRTVLVIAGGQGYVVDAATGELRRRTPWDYSYAAAPPPGRDFVLVADTTRIWAVRRDADVPAASAVRHEFDIEAEHDPSAPATRVALDGVVFDAPGPDALTGKAWQMDGWYAFRLRYDGLVVEPGPRVAAEWGAVTADPARGGFAADDGPGVWPRGRLL